MGLKISKKKPIFNETSEQLRIKNSDKFSKFRTCGKTEREICIEYSKIYSIRIEPSFPTLIINGRLK